MIKFSKIFNSFSTTTILKPPIPLKRPTAPLNSPLSQMSPSVLAQKLNITESALRKQMINPKNNVVSK
jgi:hypothetical protein